MPLAIRIHKFYTTYEPEKNPEKLAEGQTMRAIDWCEYEPLGGEPGRSINVSRIIDLERVRPFDPLSNDLAAAAANERWDAIRPAYEAWKQGQEIPLDGTPLGAWPGISPAQAEMLRAVGIRTVEEFEAANDAVISRIRLPNVRELQAQAARFRAASDQTRVSAQIAAKDRQIDELNAQLMELKELVHELAGKEAPAAAEAAEAAEPAKRRAGRPPKAKPSDDIAA